VLTTAAAGACGAASGCAGPKRATQEPSAPPSSLVYSPGAKITAEREAQASRPPAGEILRTGVHCRVHLRRDAAGLAGSAGLAGVAGVACANAAIDAEANNVAIRADSFFMCFVFLVELSNKHQCFDCAGYSSASSPSLTARIIPGLTNGLIQRMDRCFTRGAAAGSSSRH